MIGIAAQRASTTSAPRSTSGAATPARESVLSRRPPLSFPALPAQQPSSRTPRRSPASALLLPPTSARSPQTPSTAMDQASPSVASICPLSAAMTCTATGARTPSSCTLTRTASTAQPILGLPAAMLARMPARSSSSSAQTCTRRAARRAPMAGGSAAMRRITSSAPASSRRTGALATILLPTQPRSARLNTRTAWTRTKTSNPRSSARAGPAKEEVFFGTEKPGEA